MNAFAFVALQEKIAAPTGNDLRVLLPVLILSVGAIVVLMLDLFLRRSERQPNASQRTALFMTTLLALLLSVVTAAFNYSFAEPRELVLSPTLSSSWTSAPFASLSCITLTVIALLVLLMATPWLEADERRHEGEYCALLLLFPVGGAIMVAARDLMVSFIGLEILSISLYVLTALRRRRTDAVEAGLKYFLLGAFAAGFFLYGASLIYAGNGDLRLPDLGPVSRPGLPVPTGLAALGGALLFVALFFKASLAPFHMWTPDVYQGAGTPVTALMSTGTKAAAFFLLVVVAPWIPREMLPVVPVISLLTMLAGNAGALAQQDLKRLIAYSGIAHAGYLMVGYTALVRGTDPLAAPLAIRAILFYFVTYAVTNLGALGVVAYLERADGRPATIDGLRGAAARHPVAAACLTLCALSLGGIPPTAGFWGKYQLFAAAIHCEEYVLAIAGILLSAIALYYYLRIVTSLYMGAAQAEGEAQPAPVAQRGHPLAIVAMTVPSAAVVLFGLLPNLLLDVLVYVKL